MIVDIVNVDKVQIPETGFKKKSRDALVLTSLSQPPGRDGEILTTHLINALKPRIQRLRKHKKKDRSDKRVEQAFRPAVEALLKNGFSR